METQFASSQCLLLVVYTTNSSEIVILFHDLSSERLALRQLSLDQSTHGLAVAEICKHWRFLTETRCIS